jgi:DNA polymerase-1
MAKAQKEDIEQIEKEIMDYQYIKKYAQERLRFYTQVRKKTDIPPIITDKFQFKGLVKKLKNQKVFAYDTETTSLRYFKEAQLVGISISWGRENTYYIPVGHLPQDTEQLPVDYVIKHLKPIFESRNKLII